MPLRITFDVAQTSARWTDSDLRAVKTAVRAALQHQIGTIQHRVGVGITLTTDARIQKLNAKWLGKNQPTNVLSFPTDALANITDYPERIPLPLGDLVLAHPICARESKDYGIPFRHHLMFLAVHGTLHLLGYDHATNAQHRQMMRVELAVLAQLGLANPYPFMHNHGDYA